MQGVLRALSPRVMFAHNWFFRGNSLVTFSVFGRSRFKPVPRLSSANRLSVCNLILPVCVSTATNSTSQALRSTNWSLRLLNLRAISPRSPLWQRRRFETANFFKKEATLMPEPLAIEKNQRPFHTPNKKICNFTWLCINIIFKICFFFIWVT